MSKQVRIAIDAMGGDHGPSVIVPGAALALRQRPDTLFVMAGDEALLKPLLAAEPDLARATRILHTTVAVRMDDRPSQALRAGRRTSSMWMAIDAVKTGEADVVISAGNTGALMAMSKICLRTMAHVDRPAIAAMWPTMRGVSIVLDVGASIGADAQHLTDLAIMGAAMARIVLGIERPTVGLLNVGVEEIKGLEEIKAAGRRLKDLALPSLDYRGFVEGDDLGKGTVDVVVTEGFAGNIALKSAEGTAVQIGRYLREVMGRNWKSKIGYWLAREAFQALRDKLDPRRVNGGVFLGLDGVVIKSHGGTDALGFSRAISVGREMVTNDLLTRIRDQLSLSQDHQTAAASSTVPLDTALGVPERGSPVILGP